MPAFFDPLVVLYFHVHSIHSFNESPVRYVAGSSACKWWSVSEWVRVSKREENLAWSDSVSSPSHLSCVHSLPFSSQSSSRPIYHWPHSVPEISCWITLLITYPHSTLLFTWSIAIQSTVLTLCVSSLYLAPFAPDVPDEIVPYHCPSLSFLHFAHLHFAVPSISGPIWYGHPSTSPTPFNCWMQPHSYPLFVKMAVWCLLRFVPSSR